MRRFWHWLAWGGSSLLFACGSGGERESDSYATGLAALCDGLHQGFRRCGLAAGESDYCGYNPQGYRGTALAAVGACLSAEDCSTLSLEQPGDACFEQVRNTQSLSAGVIDYCESAATAYFRCNTWWAVEDCAQQMSLWGDEILERAKFCHDHSCDTLSDCEKLTFELKQ